MGLLLGLVAAVIMQCAPVSLTDPVKTQPPPPEAFLKTFSTNAIPTIDGKYLAATTVIPNGGGRYPVILIQTPYDKEDLSNSYFSLLAAQPLFDSALYAFVIVDWRGFFGSQAAAVSGYDRGKDGVDCINWIIGQPWSDGSVGTWGVSALGYIQYLTMVKQHPAHKCAVPIFAHSAYRYSDIYPGGVYRKEYMLIIGAVYGLDATFRQHPYDDLFWTLSGQFPIDKLTVPVLVVAGAYDVDNRPAIDIFNALRASGGVNAREGSRLLLGSWIHQAVRAGGADGEFTEQEMKFIDTDNVIQRKSLAFFNYHMRNETGNEVSSWSVASVHDYGSGIWNGFAAWPPPGAVRKRWYLHKSTVLSETSPSSAGDTVTYQYRPIDPSPTIGGPTLLDTLDKGPHDQRPIQSRGDGVFFSTETLSTPIRVRGMVHALFNVSTAGDGVSDTDFAIRLTDIHPDGTSLLLSDGIARLKLHQSYQTPDTIQANTVYSLVIELCNQISHTFGTGHKIGIFVTSANYSRFDKNMNNGLDFSEMLSPGVVVNNTVHCNSGYASYIELPIE
ncbi:MAG: CocE/NonD family hydrolase [Spirochaetota bacterium]